MRRGPKVWLLAAALSWVALGWAGWRYRVRLAGVETTDGVIVARVRPGLYRVRLASGATAAVAVAPADAGRLGLRPGRAVLLARRRYPWHFRGEWYLPPY